MPIYTYHCEICHTETEEIVSYQEKDTKEILCPKCNARLVWKGLESFSFKFSNVKHGGAVMSDGSTKAGNWNNKDAKLNKGRRTVKKWS